MSRETLPIVHVAGAIIARDGKILAARRASGMDGWEFPGGKLEEGETSEQALRREIREELDLELSFVWLLDTVEYDYDDFHLSMDCFVCPIASDAEPKRLEHAEFRWLSLDELLDVDWLPADHDLVRTIGVFWDQIFSPEHL